MNNKIDEKLVERLVGRIEELNTNILKKIGKTIKEIKNLTPTQAHQLQTILKYGNNYKDIVNKIAKTTNLNIDEIDNIFSAYAKQDYAFAKDFYDYKGLTYKSYKDFELLNRQVNALSRITKQGCLEIAKTKALGYTITDLKGNVKFKQLKDAYQYAIDQAILSVSQGKDTFDNQMYGILRDLGGGLKTIDYESGRTRRLDSALRMNIQDGLRDLHNETQKVIGEDFGADGVEITVHESPAPDHADLQGRQFSTVKPNKNKLSEFEKLQNNEPATDYKGVTYTHEHRPISQYNCYHTTFAILLGVNNPQYTDEQLKQIKDRNEKGFEFEGKHYTMYEGTQLQRRIETEIRKQKDTQILARESDNKQLIGDSQYKITQLTGKYKELSKASGLSMKQDRLRVSGYKRIKVEIEKPKTIEKPKIEVVKEPKAEPKKIFNYDSYKEKFEGKGVHLNDKIKNMDSELLQRNLEQLDYLTDKYNVISNQELDIDLRTKRSCMAETWYRQNRVDYNNDYFYSKERLVRAEKNGQITGWHNPVKEENLDLYTTTHEFGHVVENDYIRRYLKEHKGINTSAKQDWITYEEKQLRQSMDKEIRDDMFKYIQKREKISITDIKQKYLSGYGRFKNHYEWFAETFTQLELGEKNLLTEAMQDWLERNKK